MKRHDWKLVTEDAGAGIGLYESYECSGCGGCGGVPCDPEDTMSFDRRNRPSFIGDIEKGQINLDLDCDIAKEQIEALKAAQAKKKPAIQLMSDDFVEAAKAMGARTAKVTFDSPEAIVAAGVPKEVAGLLDLDGMEVWMRLEDGTMQVQLFSHDDFTGYGFGRGPDASKRAMLDALLCRIGSRMTRRPDSGEWDPEDLKKAARMLGGEP